MGLLVTGELEQIYSKILEIAQKKKFINTLEISRETGIPEEKVRLALLMLRDMGRLTTEEVSCGSTCDNCPFKKVCTLKSPSQGRVFIVKLGEH
uniref:Transcriptional regulator HTH-type FeoC domain-containing protein n=1 Tax=Thermofilum adornatum TaxID=1365176 RepID=A0A7C1CBS2_9CREN